MPVSRRDFFTQLAREAIGNLPNLFPSKLTKLLGLIDPKPITPDEAAFALVKARQKNPAKRIRPDDPDNILRI